MQNFTPILISISRNKILAAAIIVLTYTAVITDVTFLIPIATIHAVAVLGCPLIDLAPVTARDFIGMGIHSIAVPHRMARSRIQNPKSPAHGSTFYHFLIFLNSPIHERIPPNPPIHSICPQIYVLHHLLIVLLGVCFIL